MTTIIPHTQGKLKMTANLTLPMQHDEILALLEITTDGYLRVSQPLWGKLKDVAHQVNSLTNKVTMVEFSHSEVKQLIYVIDWDWERGFADNKHYLLEPFTYKLHDFVGTEPKFEQKQIPVSNYSTSSAPISIIELNSLDETIENPIVVYYTAEGKLDPYEEDKRVVLICDKRVEEVARRAWECRGTDLSQYERREISQRGEYKIVPGGDTDGLINVGLYGTGELHEFDDGIMLVTRTEVKDEAIETWFPQSNMGRFRDYEADSVYDIEQFNGPDCPVDSDCSFEAEDTIYLYV